MRPNQCLPSSTSLRAPAPRGFSIRVTRPFDRVPNEEACVFTTPASLRRAAKRFSWGAFSSPGCPVFPQGIHEPCDRASDIPVVTTRPRYVHSTRIEFSPSPRPLSPCLREKSTTTTTRDAFHRRVTAPALPLLSKREIGAASDRSHDFAAVIRSASFVRPPRLRRCSRSFVSP